MEYLLPTRSDCLLCVQPGVLVAACIREIQRAIGLRRPHNARQRLGDRAEVPLPFRLSHRTHEFAPEHEQHRG